MSSPEKYNLAAVIDETENKPSAEKKEFQEAVFESLLEVSVKINEGANGIICKIDSSEISSQVWADLLVTDPDRKDKALKMLKIYKPGTGAKEFAAQKKMYDLIANQENVAQIPRPWFCETFEIKSEKARLLLAKLGFDARQPKIDVILMDLVEGEELAASFYRNIITNDDSWIAKNRYIDLTDTADTNKLQKLAGELLKFEEPRDVKATSELDRKQKEQAIMNRNADKLYRRLKKNGFSFSRNSFEKIDNTLKIMHQAGWIHGDLHERNIMISPDGKPIIVDFGFARKVSDKEEEKARLDSYNGEAEDPVLQDGYIIRRLRSLLETEVVVTDPYTETFGKNLAGRLKKEEQDDLQASIMQVTKNAAGWKNYSEAREEILTAARKVSGDTNTLSLIYGALFYHAGRENRKIVTELSELFSAFEKKQYRNRKIMLERKFGLEEREYFHLKQALALIKNSDK